MALINLNPSYSLEPGAGIADVWWKTGRIQVKASGEETGGSFAQVETNDPRGTATPMHVHRNEEETFFVLDGEITFDVDGERTELGAGEYALVPRGVPHGYVVRSEQARMLVTFSPSGFEQAFIELGVPASEGEEPPADSVFPPPEEMAKAFASYGCEIVGPPPSA